MRLDLPQDLPRRRTSQERPLEASPLELHRDRLVAQMKDKQALNLPRPEEKAKRIPDQPEPKQTLTNPIERRPRRDLAQPQGIGISLRAEELTMLSAVARFRVIATRDLADTVYGGRESLLERDVAFLKEHGLVVVDAVRSRRDGRRGTTESIEVVTLSRLGRDLVRQTAGLSKDQTLYSGLVKPREVEHDTQIYRAYLKEAERIARSGGTNLCVQLDFELKAKVQKAIYAQRKADPDRDLEEVKQQVAQAHDLPFVNGGIQIPDARIVYDLDQGSRTGHQDIEVLTAAYRPGHLRNKVQAGFHLYASASDRSTLTARLEDDHHLMENILEL